MKVLFIVPYPREGPSSRFRVEQYLGYLREKNIIFSLRPFYNSPIYKILHKKGNFFRKVIFLLLFSARRIVDVFLARGYDIVFVHRESHPLGGVVLERLFKFFSGRLIYDFDDSIFLPNSANVSALDRVAKYLKRPSKVAEIITLSDCVIVGNKFLAEYARKFNQNVVVLPTCIDTDKYSPSEKSPDKKKLIIGWIGSPWTVIYISLLDKVLGDLAKLHDNIEIRIVGAEYNNPACPCITCRDWSLDSEIEELRQFDIGIMPLSDDEWAKGKCAFKIIQYMAMGIPVVASPVGMNLEVIEDGRSGFFAARDEEWIGKLSLLIKDDDLRKSMGRRGREIAQERYSLISNRDKFINILERCAQR